jgi:Mg-chelatase subunit ChlI
MPAAASLIKRGLGFTTDPAPFTAIVGQERAKRALILNAVNPSVGGILLWGEEGNGKTLMMTSFAHLLEGMKKANGTAAQPWNSDDRYLMGVFPSSDTISFGLVDTELNIGVLSKARKGKDPNELRFVLDSMSRGHFEILEAFRRMAMHIRVDPLEEPTLRVEVAKRLRDHMGDPKKVRKDFDSEEKQLRDKILKARDALPKVSLPSKMAGKIAQICHLKTLPMKMDFLISELARTNAAFEGRESVTVEDLQDAADLVLAYRTDEKLVKMLKSE